MKDDYDALFGPGRHTLRIEDVKAHLVDPFNSLRRFDLYLALNSLVAELTRCGVLCEIWFDGSFVTRKQEPNDIDLSIMIHFENYDKLGEEGKELLDKITFPDVKYLECLDCFLCIIYPKGDPRRLDDPPEDWSRMWSFEHNERYLKGFGIMQVGK
jgi:hypothetical protein